MFRSLFSKRATPTELLSSRLYDQNTFYKAFLKDLNKAHYEVIIESPFITTRRIDMLLPYFRRLIERGVYVVINTKPPEELDPDFRLKTYHAITVLQQLGVQVLLTGGHHRKLAIIDRQVLW